jgi:hypothetical protein
MSAEWRDVAGYEGLYQVSSDGRVKSRKKILSVRYNKLGYPVVVLWKSGEKPKNKLTHRLVAEAFIDHLEGKPHVNHIDGNKANNCVENLEWCTASENAIHAYQYGLTPSRKGTGCGRAKLDDDKVREIRKLLSNTELTQHQIATMFGVSRTSVAEIKTGVRWSHVV